jgi:hypothetical protein
MTATLADIRIALEKKAYDVLKPLGLTFSAKNKKFTPKGKEKWARVSVRFAQTRTLENGEDSPLGIRNGVLMIQIFIQPGVDVKVGEDICDVLEKEFRFAHVDCVNCGEPYSEEIGIDADASWYQLNVNIPFWAWIGE